MKRLINKNAANEIKYEFVSPILVQHIADGTGDLYNSYYLEDDKEYLDEISHEVASCNENLAEYVEPNYDKLPENVITSIRPTVGGDGKMHTFVECTQELSNEQISSLISFIEGQFSDGWGEGFEQHEITSYDDTQEFEEWDEDMETVEYFNEDVEISVYACPFASGHNWGVKLV